MKVPTQKLNVKLRNEFLIELPSNRTTGHRWEANYDKLLLQLSTTNYKRISKKTGGGGTESFAFIPCEKGITLVRMVYKRPWEKINTKEVLYEVTIED
ncbi:MAG: protease inhibitor I42 family protein [Candidatus Bathyarchaeia archaeon]|jgi:predicted secreted protein